MSKTNLIALVTALGLAALIWALDRWFFPKSEALPILSRMAFTVALMIFSGRLMEEMSRLQGNSPRDMFQRGAASAVFWYCFMIVCLGVNVPSVESIMWLPGAILIGWLAGRTPVSAKQSSDKPERPHQFWWMVALVVVTIAISVLPILPTRESTIFSVIIAITLVIPGVDRWSDVKWGDWLLTILGAAALLTGLYTAN